MSSGSQLCVGTAAEEARSSTSPVVPFSLPWQRTRTTNLAGGVGVARLGDARADAEGMETAGRRQVPAPPARMVAKLGGAIVRAPCEVQVYVYKTTRRPPHPSILSLLCKISWLVRRPRSPTTDFDVVRSRAASFLVAVAPCQNGRWVADDDTHAGMTRRRRRRRCDRCHGGSPWKTTHDEPLFVCLG